MIYLLFHQHHRFRRRERKTSQELNSTRCEWNVEKYYNRQWRGKTWNENKRMKQQCPPRRFSIRIGSQEESIDRPFRCSFLFSSRSLIVQIAAQWRQRKPIGHRFRRYRFEKKDSPWPSFKIFDRTDFLIIPYLRIEIFLRNLIQ